MKSRLILIVLMAWSLIYADEAASYTLALSSNNTNYGTLSSYSELVDSNTSTIITATETDSTHLYNVEIVSGTVDTVSTGLEYTITVHSDAVVRFDFDLDTVLCAATGDANAVISFYPDSIAAYGETITCSLTVSTGYVAKGSFEIKTAGRWGLYVYMTKDTALTVVSRTNARRWKGGGSDFNDSTYWYGWGPLLSSDSLIMDSTATAATASANVEVKALTTTSGYTGNLSFSGLTGTYSGNVTLNGTGTLHLGNRITLNGASSTFHIGNGVSTVTATSCDVVMTGTTAQVIDDNKGVNFKTLTLGANANVANNGSAASYYTNSTTPFTMGTGAVYISNQTIIIGLTGSSVFASLGLGYTISGASALAFSILANSITATLPAITTSNTSIALRDGVLATGGNITQTGAT